MAITWQQVAAPDMTDVSRMLNSGASQTASALQNLASAFDPIKQASAARRNETKNLNTLKAIDQINAIQDVGELRTKLDAFNSDNLIEQYGGADNVDLKTVLSHAANAEKNLTEKLDTRQRYDKERILTEEQDRVNSIMENVFSYTNSKDLEGAMPALASNTRDLQYLGASTLEKMQSRLDQLKQNEAQAVERGVRLDGMRNSNELGSINLANAKTTADYTKLSSALPALAKQRIDAGDDRKTAENTIRNTLINDPTFKKLSTVQQEKLIGEAVNLLDPQTSMFVDSVTKAAAQASIASTEADAQRVEQNKASELAQKMQPQITEEELNSKIKAEWLDGGGSIVASNVIKDVVKNTGVVLDEDDLEEINGDFNRLVTQVEKEKGRKLSNVEKMQFLTTYLPTKTGVNADFGFKNGFGMGLSGTAIEQMKNTQLYLDLLKSNVRSNEALKSESERARKEREAQKAAAINEIQNKMLYNR